MHLNFDSVYGLHSGFLASVVRFPQHPALDVDGSVYTYHELYNHSAAIAVAIVDRLPIEAPSMVGVLANRSLPVYSGILGSLMSGRGVVPLNPCFPSERTVQMMTLAGLQAVVVDAGAEEELDVVLQGLSQPLLVLLPQTDDVDDLRSRWPQHSFLAQHDLPTPASDWMPVSVQPDDVAYLFFTSGSTGMPKGVGVLHRNTLGFVAMSLQRYQDIGIDATDRFSQFYDVTFDSSLFDLFVSWASGACLCAPSAREWFNPNRYIVDKALTVIDIVPSAGHAMNRRDGWRPGRFPDLRLGRFGGEALSADLAAALAAAAPNAVIDNAYGPTECTVDAAYYRWDPDRSPGESLHGMVPIGYAGTGVDLLVVDEHLAEVPVGDDGELMIGGPQVTPGYWNDPQRTATVFLTLPGREGVYYRTGDLVKRPAPGQPILFLGRMDHQIKIGGVRIELGEVESVLREATGTGQAVALGWPLTSSGAAGIVAFVEAAHHDPQAIRTVLREKLPNVMVPREIRVLDQLPLNVNGKVDRKALLEILKGEST